MKPDLVIPERYRTAYNNRAPLNEGDSWEHDFVLALIEDCARLEGALREIYALSEQQYEGLIGNQWAWALLQRKCRSALEGKQ